MNQSDYTMVAKGEEDTQAYGQGSAKSLEHTPGIGMFASNDTEGSDPTVYRPGSKVKEGDTPQAVAAYLERRLQNTNQDEESIKEALDKLMQHDIDGSAWLEMLGEPNTPAVDKIKLLNEELGITGVMIQMKLMADARVSFQAARESPNPSMGRGSMGVRELDHQAYNKGSEPRSRSETPTREESTDEVKWTKLQQDALGKRSDDCPTWKEKTDLPTSASNQRFGVGITSYATQFCTKLGEVLRRVFRGVEEKSELDELMEGASDFTYALDEKFGNKIYNGCSPKVQKMLLNESCRALKVQGPRAGRMSAVRILQTITNEVDHKSAVRAESLEEEMAQMKAVERGHLLAVRLVEIEEKFEELDKHGLMTSKASRCNLLNRMMKSLVNRKDLLMIICKPLMMCELRCPRDPVALMETLKMIARDLGDTDKGSQDHRQGDRKRTNSGWRERTQGGAYAVEMSERICFFDREGKDCERKDCALKHGSGSGKTCSDKEYLSNGMCSNFSTCADMHPWDANKHGPIDAKLGKPPPANSKYSPGVLKMSLKAISAMVAPANVSQQYEHVGSGDECVDSGDERIDSGDERVDSGDERVDSDEEKTYVTTRSGRHAAQVGNKHFREILAAQLTDIPEDELQAAVEDTDFTSSNASDTERSGDGDGASGEDSRQHSHMDIDTAFLQAGGYKFGGESAPMSGISDDGDDSSGEGSWRPSHVERTSEAFTSVSEASDLPGECESGGDADEAPVETRAQLVDLGWDQQEVEQWEHMQIHVDRAMERCKLGEELGTTASVSDGEAPGAHLLLDSGTFEHMFGTGVMHLVTNRRRVRPCPVKTASGTVWLSEKGDLQLARSTLFDGFVNPYMDTSLLSEGKMVLQENWGFNANSQGKLITEPSGAQYWAYRNGVLFYAPVEMMCSVEESEDARVSGGVQDYDQTAHGLETDNQQQLEFMMACSVMGMREHRKTHKGKVNEGPCVECITGKMQDKPARKGGSNKVRDLVTAGLDCMITTEEDCNGTSIDLNMVMVESRYGDVTHLTNKASATIAKAWKAMKNRVEALTDPGGKEQYKIQRVHTDQGTEFDGAMHGGGVGSR